jgi:hypothetical protein
VGLKSLKSLNLTNGYPNKNNNNNKNKNKNNNKVKSKPLELFELAGKKLVESRQWKRFCLTKHFSGKVYLHNGQTSFSFSHFPIFDHSARTSGLFTAVPNYYGAKLRRCQMTATSPHFAQQSTLLYAFKIYQ